MTDPRPLPMLEAQDLDRAEAIAELRARVEQLEAELHATDLARLRAEALTDRDDLERVVQLAATGALILDHVRLHRLVILEAAAGRSVSRVLIPREDVDDGLEVSAAAVVRFRSALELDGAFPEVSS